MLGEVGVVGVVVLVVVGCDFFPVDVTTGTGGGGETGAAREG